MQNPMWKLSKGSTRSFSNVLRLTAGGNSYTWGSLRVCIGSQIVVSETDKAVYYYVIGILGRGATSNVWHALDCSGNEVVIKMYVKSMDKDGKELDSEGFEREAMRATKKEARRLKEFYGFDKSAVYCKKVSGFWCVVMPFFRPVLKGERSDTVKGVKAVLESSFKDHDLKYDDDDVRWSHVGFFFDCSGQKQIILYDLADLVPVEDKTDDSWVAAHCKILEEQGGIEPESVPEQFESELVPGEGGE